MIAAASPRDEAVVISRDAGALLRIGEVGVHLAVWQRSMPHALSGLSALDWGKIEDIDAPVALDELASTLPHLIAGAGYGDRAGALGHELIALARRFAAIMSCAVLRFRLEVIETDACRRFHADLVTARLLMSLIGPGTQWIHAGSDGPIEQLRAGEVGMFKGRRWTDEPLILHRSPPVSETGETRLLLALDPWTGHEEA